MKKTGIFAVLLVVLAMTSGKSLLHESADRAPVILESSVSSWMGEPVRSEPLLLAGNTACNPRAQVCED